MSKIKINFSTQEHKLLSFRSHQRKHSKSPKTPASKNQSPTRSVNNLRRLFEIRQISYQKISQRSKQPITRNLHIAKSLKKDRSFSISSQSTRYNLTPSALKAEISEAIPDFPSRTYNNERLVWSKRSGVTLPLCIITFNGVIGEFNKLKPVKERLVLTPEFKESLRLIRKNYFLVILSWSSRIETQKILKLFEEKSVNFDAFYIVRHRNRTSKFRHNYTSIIEDFQIKNFSNILIVCPIRLALEEFSTRQAIDLFYESSSSIHNKFTTLGMPVSCCGDFFDPLCILVPHLLASNKKISFKDLCRYIRTLSPIVSSAAGLGKINLPCEHSIVDMIPAKPRDMKSGIRFLVYSIKSK